MLIFMDYMMWGSSVSPAPGTLALYFFGAFLLILFNTLLIIPLLSFWYVIFLSQLIIYEYLNRELKVEELYESKRTADH